jgi:hypothetical protein
MKRISIARLALGMLLLGSMVTPSIANTLWYNGDIDLTYEANVPNQIIGGLTDKTYDDFLVPTGSNWTINTLYSNNIVRGRTTISGAYWEIRQGVSADGGGTLLFSGTSPANLDPTGRYLQDGSYQDPEITVAVTGLNISLAAGTYWLCVTPILSATDTGVYSSPTTGIYPGNSFLFYQDVFMPQENILAWDLDFSMGINGTDPNAVPLPPSILLLASALLAMGAHGFWVRER